MRLLFPTEYWDEGTKGLDLCTEVVGGHRVPTDISCCHLVNVCKIFMPVYIRLYA